MSDFMSYTTDAFGSSGDNFTKSISYAPPSYRGPDLTTDSSSSSFSTSTAFIAFFIVALIIVLIVFVVLYATKESSGGSNGFGSSCSSSSQCSAGGVCQGGTCRIPIGSSCSNNSNNCALGSTCINSVCRTPLTGTVVDSNTGNSQSGPVQRALFSSLSRSVGTSSPELLYTSSSLPQKFYSVFQQGGLVYMLPTAGNKLHVYSSNEQLKSSKPDYTLLMNRTVDNVTVFGSKLYSSIDGRIFNADLTTTKPKKSNKVSIEWCATNELGNYIASNGTAMKVSQNPVFMGPQGNYVIVDNGTYTLYNSAGVEIDNIFDQNIRGFPVVTSDGVSFSNDFVQSFNNVTLYSSI